jgi:hypothetical protein
MAVEAYIWVSWEVGISSFYRKIKLSPQQAVKVHRLYVLRIPHGLDNQFTDGVEVNSLTCLPNSAPIGTFSGTRLYRRLGQTRSHSTARMIKQIGGKNHWIQYLNPRLSGWSYRASTNLRYSVHTLQKVHQTYPLNIFVWILSLTLIVCPNTDMLWGFNGQNVLCIVRVELPRAKAGHDRFLVHSSLFIIHEL